MGYIVAYILLSWFVFLLVYVAGESYTVRKPNSRFGKWWRKHIINDDKGNDDDYWMYM